MWPADAERPVAPRFWRDAALPFIELRSVEDGRRVCYAPHSHDSFSIGVITGGISTCLNGRVRERVGPGSVVVVNPEEVHACNPVDDRPWSYHMLFLDVAWMAGQQAALGLGSGHDLRPFLAAVSRDSRLAQGLIRLQVLLHDGLADLLEKESAAVAFAATLQACLDPAPAAPSGADDRLPRAAEFIADNCTRPLSLGDICAAAGLSESYLIRAFQRCYGLTPHAFLIDRRIRYSRERLRRGHSIAEVAADAGFADQAHLHRAFKRLVAATPGQYRA